MSLKLSPPQACHQTFQKQSQFVGVSKQGGDCRGIWLLPPLLAYIIDFRRGIAPGAQVPWGHGEIWTVSQTDKNDSLPRVILVGLVNPEKLKLK